jgi:hypothetical protein
MNEQQQCTTYARKPAIRRCLRCERRFASVGAHNRLCEPCRDAITQAPTPETIYELKGATHE